MSCMCGSCRDAEAAQDLTLRKQTQHGIITAPCPSHTCCTTSEMVTQAFLCLPWAHFPVGLAGAAWYGVSTALELR